MKPLGLKDPNVLFMGFDLRRVGAQPVAVPVTKAWDQTLVPESHLRTWQKVPSLR